MPESAKFTFEKREQIWRVNLRVWVFLQNSVELSYFLFEIGVVSQNEDKLVIFVRLL